MPMAARTQDPDSLLSGLDPEQRAVAEATSGPIAVLAGAGTGKTRAITHRIAHAVATGEHDPAHTLAVTFTNRAAGEMNRRLNQLGVDGVRVRTFHSAALRQLRWAWPQAIGGQMHEVFESKSALVANSLSRARLGGGPAVVRDLCTEIEWAKVAGLEPHAYPAAAARHGRRSPGGLELEQVAGIYEGYETAKRTANRIDFEDVLLLTVGILEEHEDLRRQVQSSFRYFTVDEFQDVSEMQQRLLRTWLGDRDDVCVVGDVAQTIYSFAGADPSHLLNFARQYDNSRIIALNRCYRCSPEIIEVAEKILGAADPGAALLATRTSRRIPLVSQNPPGPKPTINEYPDEHSEAAAVVRRVSEQIASGTSPRGIAILVRINALSEQFEAQLSAAGIPYSIRGGRRFFERPEVRKAVSLLRGAARAGGTLDEAPDELPRTVRAILGSIGWSQDPPSDVGAVRENWESLSALVSLCDEIVNENPNTSFDDLVASIASREEAADAPSVDGVTIASLHAAKGMEWGSVFLVGLVDGMVPMSHAHTPAQIEEERRLLYVGVTRARRELSLSWAKARVSGGRDRKSSRFLVEVLDSGGARRARPTAAAVKLKKRRSGSCRVCGKALVTPLELSSRRCRTCPSDIDEVLLEELKRWRREKVVELSVDREKELPAYVIATDATLLALAEERPQSLAELAEIPGLGPMKLAVHGDSLLEIVRSR